MDEDEQDKERDLEDVLDNFFIRKPNQSNANNANKNFSNVGPTIHKAIPLTLRDISRSRPDADRSNVFITKNWHFQTCVAYAFVAGRCVPNKTFYKYIIDDGTDSMELSIYANIAKHRQIISLYNEATVLSGVSGTEEDKKLSGSMSRLLLEAKESIDASAIAPGMNLMLEGRPNMFRGKVGFEAFSFCLDNDRSRKMEIAFNDHLLDWYKNNMAKEN
ncbi:uncharacterized protein Dwil_GK12525 [Drosophila willistoni]|uniref:Uncharacterized protein n=1 Tax=Drosophila willistoni TaxID=7260 RepID=B4N334_DROWI|nr:uncharacterized protein LOC6645109 [Drosophila willistoni]EDW78773.2 uncharacterized protein Dwil_GK12525 [Drosophila willistoni]